ncbi:MAG: AAA domain-containing protein [Candidatus Hodarchaeota archaeon]
MASTDFGDSDKDYDGLDKRNAAIIPLALSLDTRFSNTDSFTAKALGVTDSGDKKPDKAAVKKALITRITELFPGTSETIRFLVENTTTKTFEGEKEGKYGDWRLRIDPATPLYDKTVFNNHSIVFNCRRRRRRLSITRVSLQITSKRPYPTEGILTGPVILVTNENLNDYFSSEEDFIWLLNLPKRRKALENRLESWENYLNTYLKIIKYKQAWIAYRNLERVNATQAKIQISTRHCSYNAIKRYYTGDRINVLDNPIPEDSNWLPSDDDPDPIPFGEITPGQKFKKFFTKNPSSMKKKDWIDLLIDLNDEYVISEETGTENGLNYVSSNPFNSLPKEGLLLNSVFLDQLPFTLQEKAIRRLYEGQAVNPRLEDFIFDVTEARSPIRREKIDPESLIRKDLNQKQFDALERALNSPDITLIQGPPGTGKTTVIAELCHQIALWGGKVLVASQANLAVDNALKRLANQRVIMPIRIGKHATEEGHEFIEENVVKRWFESVKTEVTKIAGEREILLNNTTRFKEAIKIIEELYEKQQNAEKKINSIRNDLNSLLSEENRIGQTKEELLEDKTRLAKQLHFTTKVLKLQELVLYEELQILFEILPSFIPLIHQQIAKLLEKSKIKGTNSLDLIETGEILVIIKEIQKNYPEVLSKIGGLKKIIDQKEKISSDEILQLTEQRQRITNKLMKTTDQNLMNQYSKELLEINRQIEVEKGAYATKIFGTSWQDESTSLRVQIDHLLKFFDLIDNPDLFQQLTIFKKALTPKNEYLPLLEQLEQLINNFQDFSFRLPASILNELIQKNRELKDSTEKNEDLIEKINRELKEIHTEIIACEREIDQNSQIIQNAIKIIQQNTKLIAQIIPDEEKFEQDFHLNEDSLQLLHQHYNNLLQQQQVELEQSRRWLALQKEWINKIENSSTEEYENLVSTYIDLANVVGATCTETGKYRFHGKPEREFDLVIIDEVSKATPPEILMPMLLGKQIVLVGDHQQLPPLFRLSTDELPIQEFGEDEDAQDLVKRFERLVTASYFQEMFEEAEEQLKERLILQYRMHSTIMRAINQFYPQGYQLKQGLNEDEEKIKNYFVLKGKSGDLTSPDTHLVWVDTTYKQVNGKTARNIEGRERGKFTSRYNEYEIEVIRKILLALDEQIQNLQTKGEQPPQKIAIISFYAGQERRLREMVRNLKHNHLIEKIQYRIGTVDRFQGMERPVVIVSLVSSPPKGSPTAFVKEFRRINVAFSRAQALLIIVGSKAAFEGIQVNIRYGKGNFIRKYSYREIINAAETCHGGNYYVRGYDIIE